MQMQYKSFIDQDVHDAAICLRQGGVICYPTDTIWGLGCDATNSDAVSKIYKIKGRDTSKSMLILVGDIEAVRNYVDWLPDIAIDLFNTTTEPLTIILQGAKNLAHNLPASVKSIGVRIVKHAFCTPLFNVFGKPIVSTSANFSGQIPPASFGEIDEKLLDTVDYVVKANRTQVPGKSSKIIMITSDNQIKQIR